jgi:DNA-binding GntR family transcriptional regulator
MADIRIYRPEIAIDFASPIPLYHQIALSIEKDIADGTVTHGARVEDETSMATRLGVSRPTTRQALQTLVERGLVIRKRGTGTWIAPPQVHRPFELTSLSDDLEKAGKNPRTTVLGYEVGLATVSEAEQLPIAVGTPLARIKRLRFANDEPLALMRNLVPAAIAPTREELSERGLYANLRRKVRIARADQAVTAQAANAEAAQYLGEKKGSPVLEVQRTSFDNMGNFIEYGRHIYRGSIYSVRSTLIAD